MPDLRTRVDALREYLTGAGSDGGAQTSPAASLGGFRSSTEAAVHAIVLSNAVLNLTVDFASGGCAPGAGTLTCLDANTVAWQDAGGARGDGLYLAGNGSQGIAEAAANPSSYVRVTRTSNSPMSGGPCAVTLSVLADNAFSPDDVSSANARLGVSEYWATLVRNEGASPAGNFTRRVAVLGTRQVSDAGQLTGAGAGTLSTTGSFADWPASGWCRVSLADGTLREIVYYSSRTLQTLTVPTAGRARLGSSSSIGFDTDLLDAVPGVAVGVDAAGVQASGSSIQTVASLTTPPVGVTWRTGVTPSTGAAAGTVGPSRQVGLWYWRDVPPLAVASPGVMNSFSDSFDSA